MPVPSTLRVDAPLSEFSVRYSNPTYIADQACPPVAVAKDGAVYFKYTKDNLRNEQDGPLGTRTPAAEIDWTVDQETINLGRYSLKELVTQEEMDNADDPLDPETDAVQALTDKLLIGREIRAAALLFDTANLTLNDTLTGTDQWNDADNSDPLGDIETGKAAMFRDPNTCVMGQEVWAKVRNHPNIVSRFQYVAGGAITRAQFADLIELDTFLVGNAKYNSAAEGQTAVSANIWGKHCALLYLEANPRPRSLTCAATFERGARREVIEWESNDPSGTWKRVEDRYLHAIVAADLGYLIEDAVA